jgi:hypothetical protein
MFIFVQVQGRQKFLPQEYIRVFRGLQFETDEEIGQKGAFCKDLELSVSPNKVL